VDDPTVINSQLQRVILPALYAPFALEGHRISQLLKDPRFVIGAVHERQEGANKLLEFDFTYKPKDRNDFIYQQGRVAVSPNENWILKHYQTTSKKYQIAFQVDVEYEPPKNEGEIRLVRQVRRRNPFSIVATSFSQLSHEQVPPSQFTLSAFGLPDINKPIAEHVPGQSARWYYWAAGVALVVAVGLKVYLGYVSKRQAKPA
jgi:hypothetical protein